jgi:hypothetical protein
MTKQSGKIRYSSSNCIQDIFGFICNYVLSYSNPGQEYIAEVYIDHLQIDEPQETKPQIVDHVHTHTPVHIPDAPVEIPVRHKPRALSPTLVESFQMIISPCFTSYTCKSPRQIQASRFASYSP